MRLSKRPLLPCVARRRDLLEAAQKEDDAEVITDDWQKVVEHPQVHFVIVGYS